MEKDLITVIEAQKEQIKYLDEHLRNLEVRVLANENITDHFKKHLEDVKKTTNKTFWLTMIILACIVVLLGSN